MNEIVNNCGNIVYKLDDTARLKRFVFLGSENSTIYMNKKDLMYENIECLERLLNNNNFDDILSIIVDYKDRCFKKDYLIYVLARCCSIRLNGNSDCNESEYCKDFKDDCFKLTLDICNIPTYLFMFIELYEDFNKKLYGSTGWNNRMKKMVDEWYNSKTIKDLMYHITKYQSRNNWTHKDVLRLAHIKTNDVNRNSIFKYITKGKDVVRKELNLYGDNPLVYLWAFEALKSETNIDNIVEYIKMYNFVREQIPTHLLNNVKIWDALLKEMPVTALLKNLNKMSAIGLFKEYPKAIDIVVKKLECVSVHPLQVLIAIKMYERGCGLKGKLKWNITDKISDVLKYVFKSSFMNLKPTNKRILLALDVSSSMSSNTVCGIDCLSAAEVSCAMAMMFKCIEKDVEVMGFSNVFKPFDINKDDDFNTNLENIRNQNFGNTDCSLPFTWALKNNRQYDCVIVFTDNETNTNVMKPSDALNNYRKSMNLNTKLVVVGLTSNGFSIADPNDKNMLDVCGFDINMFDTISEFIKQ